MKRQNKKYQDEYESVYLYANIISKIKNSVFVAEIRSPFKDALGHDVELVLFNDALTGRAENNYQRRMLEESRNKIIMLYKQGKHKVVGKYDTKKQTATLYITERISQDEIKILNILNKNLTENKIPVIIDTDEKNRYRYNMRIERGDRVIRHDREH